MGAAPDGVGYPAIFEGKDGADVVFVRGVSR